MTDKIKESEKMNDLLNELNNTIEDWAKENIVSSHVDIAKAQLNGRIEKVILDSDLNINLTCVKGLVNQPDIYEDDIKYIKNLIKDI